MPIPAKGDLVERVRTTLQAVPVRKRYYDVFVNSLIDEKYDETGDNSRANRKYPPHTLVDMFVERPDVMKVIGSSLYAKQKRWREVEGPYTEKGHFAVLDNIADGAGLLEREQWVVPLTRDEQPDSIPKHLEGLAADYDAHYIAQWTDWMADLTVRMPANLKEAKDIYTELAKPDYPYLRILHALEDHTQWKRARGVVDNENMTKRVNQNVQQKLLQKTGLRFNVDVKMIGNRLSTVPNEFKKTVEFGVPASVNGAVPITDTSLAKYVSLLNSLRDDIQKLEDVSPNPDARLMADRLIDATKQVDALLQPLDDKAKTLLRPLLMNPLLVVAARLPPLSAISRFPTASAAQMR
jgi:type VI secretion system protein ImpL